ncbi:hypothetical protein [Puniceibacterium sp. IMCC21224]|uniref:hypothetical protein n=1 Tax=Puniceibacterium sp. IMCC21224 TaxID=1618204 RepID=UPI00064DF296|nr:hypothetical protein [Puniceibacterium sp. IMCC21224]KMK68935.1 hypothetical protein IMCC21224_113823 [Puniceibacterium sp. IMCC21224]
MSDELPDYYFRIRDNGALVFRIESGNRQRRIEMDQIAAVNIRSGDVKPQGDRTLDATDMAAIHDWMAQRKSSLAAREIDDIHRTVEHLNLTAQWAQSRASGDQLDAVTDDLLLAMHDLRTVLVRKKAERLTKE